MSLNIPEIERRFFDLLASTILDFSELARWMHEGLEVALPFTRTVSPASELAFETRASLGEGPGAWLLRLDITGNGELYVDGELYQAVDEYHRLAKLPPGLHALRVVATPRRLFGESPWVFGFIGAGVASVLWEEFTTLLAVIDLVQLAQTDATVREVLSRAASKITVSPSQLQVYAASVMLYGFTLQERNPELRALRWDYAYNSSVYGPAVSRGLVPDTPRPDPEAVRRELEAVLEELEPLFAAEKPEGEVFLFGHAHIDTAWLWPFSETKRKVRRTFSTVVRLAEMGYKFTYVQSGAQNYSWLEELDPGLFSKVRRLVEEGLWLPVGGMWVESDTQLLTGESLARQFLYGQRYFLEKFGKKCRIGWLPDSFGFSAQLPQLLRKSGLEVFVTHKVMWNDTNEFPYHAFVWRALDGSEVIPHILVQTYSGVLTAEKLRALWSRYKQKDVFPVAVHAYGFGDGGGGPTFTMLERVKLLEKLSLVPRLAAAPGEDEYVGKLMESRDKLPVWTGEIYNEFHRGVYTTNLRVKQLMAMAENEAVWADFLAAVSLLHGFGGARRFSEEWKVILRNQFHDVLPGSSCYEAYQESYRELEEAIKSLEDASQEALARIVEHVSAPEGSIVLFNRLSWPVVLPVEIPSCAYASPSLVACQEAESRAIAVVKLPPLGYTTLYPAPGGTVFGEARAYESGGRVVLENGGILVAVDRGGRISSVYSRRHGFEALRGLELRVHVDKPGNFDAWDIDKSALLLPSEEPALVEGPRIASTGPAVASAAMAFRYSNSTIRLNVNVYSGLELVELDFRFDWHDKSRLLKAWVDTVFDVDRAYCHVPFGVVERLTKPLDRRAAAMFEVPALHWVDVSDGKRGLAVIAVDRHGYSFEGGRVGLSLLKSPSMPNPWSDLGEMGTRVYLCPHAGDYRSGRVYEMAYALFSGAKRAVKQGSGGSLPPEKSLLELRGAVLESLKVSEDGRGVVARVYDITGAGAEVEGLLPVEATVYESDIPETSLVAVSGGSTSFRLKLSPFEIKTLVVKVL
ncbi:alpha-mannosidase [Infirmifilum lucidum]|uniref:Alpha-mannosidase n=1 Tax=Infirmifilum lucidum TaxID=2776706 RepID=A0A7L9FGG7_9CREN|nr:glycoside hydrolase family 38 C-terminal domain-containing protein [Infirmifilum lucidum]QOJ78890.1 alpha-mannosidase [Infirmifilum lucidum]